LVIVKLIGMVGKYTTSTKHGWDSFCDGLVHGATNELMTSVLKDQIESSGFRVNFEYFTSI
jgi:hypothetical protein